VKLYVRFLRFFTFFSKSKKNLTFYVFLSCCTRFPEQWPRRYLAPTWYSWLLVSVSGFNYLLNQSATSLVYEFIANLLLTTDLPVKVAESYRHYARAVVLRTRSLCCI